MFHRCHKVEMFEVKHHEFCIGCRYDAVEEEFYGKEIGCWSAAVTWVVYEVAPNHDVHLKLVFLSIMVHAYNSALHDVAVSSVWVVLLVDEENGFCGSGKAYYFLA